ncbi:hypothetical protein V22_31760 [Calycomorphotria hydatis]|uniref:Uncharacterized protein n=1 Tax=Calycomorphotria hydatis TaxID=2528027 RepID=A0A517TC27_9PLAN|nr:hypothetical protein V22_31760 [Calycomorphotria hydatis]
MRLDLWVVSFVREFSLTAIPVKAAVFVIPAKAGIQTLVKTRRRRPNSLEQVAGCAAVFQ